jgi:hypothetical protein
MSPSGRRRAPTSAAPRSAPGGHSTFRVPRFALRCGFPSFASLKHAVEPIYRDAPNQHVKIIRYPGSDSAANGQGVGAHKDSGFLTFVLQDTEEGLEIEAQDGKREQGDRCIMLRTEEEGYRQPLSAGWRRARHGRTRGHKRSR